jgi:hypothetical protein
MGGDWTLQGGGFASARKLSCPHHGITGSGGGDHSNGRNGRSCSLLVALTNSVPAAVPTRESASALATADIASAAAAGLAALKSAHAAWWLDSFWPRSLLSVPDAIFESFHAIQLYKVGSATRCEVSGPLRPFWRPF